MGDFAQGKLLYMVFSLFHEILNVLTISEQMCQSFGQSAVHFVRGRGYLGWIEYIARVLSSLAMVFN